MDYLEDVGYRIYLLNHYPDFYSELRERLESKKYKFPPYLGHANLHAIIEYHGEADFKNINPGIHKVHSVIPISAINKEHLKSFDGTFNVVHNIPMVMESRKSKEGNYLFPNLKRIENVIFSEKINCPLIFELNEHAEGYKVKLNEKRKNIIILPIYH